MSVPDEMRRDAEKTGELVSQKLKGEIEKLLAVASRYGIEIKLPEH